MTLTRMLWAALGGSLGVIVLMTGAWAHEVQARQDATDLRLNTAEQHYAAIQADLQDLREHVKELKQMLQEQQQYGAR